MDADLHGADGLFITGKGSKFFYEEIMGNVEAGDIGVKQDP